MTSGRSARTARAMGSVGVAGVLLLSGCGWFGGDEQPEGSGSATGSAGSSSGGSASGSSTESASSDPLAPFYDQQVSWKRCYGSSQCTKVKVPLDYSDPQGDQVELSVVRLRAKNPRGSLLVNPGGPGASAVDYALAASVVLTPEVRKAYDVIGVDPRGVVGSDPVDCVTDKQIDDIFIADGTPDSPAEEEEVAQISAEIGAGCKQRSPELAAHMGTENAARDLDIVRAVLGEDKLNVMFKSYATYLGAMYADLFPERVGRMVLDGVLPSSLNADELASGQARAFDVALRHFVADCLEQQDCPLSGTVDQGIQRIQELLAQLEDKPLPGIGSRNLEEAQATWAISAFLYAPPADWGMLRYGLAAAFDGDGSVLMEMMDERAQRNPDGTYANNGNEAFYAVSCLDRPGMGGIDHIKDKAAELAADAPVFGEYLLWGTLPCWEWPLAPEDGTELRKLTAKGSDPILVVSTKYDPATPYEWGVQVARELDNATLLTYEGEGHSAYTSGSTCIDKLVDSYLLDATLPTAGVVCKPDAS